MLLDHYAYVNDALMYDAYIHDAYMCDACQKWGWTNQPTNKAILGVG